MIDPRPIEVVDTLDPEGNKLDMEVLAKFMGVKDEFNSEEGDDFLVIDNLVEFFGSDDILSTEGLANCRNEAMTIAS